MERGRHSKTKSFGSKIGVGFVHPRLDKVLDASQILTNITSPVTQPPHHCAIPQRLLLLFCLICTIKRRPLDCQMNHDTEFSNVTPVYLLAFYTVVSVTTCYSRCGFLLFTHLASIPSFFTFALPPPPLTPRPPSYLHNSPLFLPLHLGFYDFFLSLLLPVSSRRR
ncbi:hypothetical protein CPB86DRAFT_512049 [Serendipita vermifera]|nr:hypothetical protein CPB86DRAFT_512049 [Serendipita vermifera]